MLRLVPAPQYNGVIALAVVAVFVADIAIGGALAAGKSAPVRTASNDTAISLLNRAPPITWHRRYPKLRAAGARQRRALLFWLRCKEQRIAVALA